MLACDGEISRDLELHQIVSTWGFCYKACLNKYSRRLCIYTKIPPLKCSYICRACSSAAPPTKLASTLVFQATVLSALGTLRRAAFYLQQWEAFKVQVSQTRYKHHALKKKARQIETNPSLLACPRCPHGHISFLCAGHPCKFLQLQLTSIN